MTSNRFIEIATVSALGGLTANLAMTSIGQILVSSFPRRRESSRLSPRKPIDSK
ncbi:MAG: hypothetical protein JW762_04810 [Dehalococcoidales bacterium]|nr:hypothetical protein [Dehalococcoidales bacterium]